MHCWETEHHVIFEIGKIRLDSWLYCSSTYVLPAQDRTVATPERLRRSPNLLEKMKYGQLFPAEQASTVTLEPDSVCCLLSPTNSNIHK